MSKPYDFADEERTEDLDRLLQAFTGSVVRLDFNAAVLWAQAFERAVTDVPSKGSAR
jgi:hypothetical protein